MFAETDVFWKSPSVYDVIGVGGLALGLASIWYAWHLAKKQLRADFKKAATEAVDVMTRFVLGGELAEAVRFLKDAQRYLADRKWELGILRIDDAVSAVSRLGERLGLSGEEQKRITELLDKLGETSKATRAHMRSKSKRLHLEDQLLSGFGVTVVELERFRGRLLATNSGGARNE